MQRATAFAFAMIALGCKPGASKKPGEQIAVTVPPPTYGSDLPVSKEVVSRCKFDQRLPKVIVAETPGARLGIEGGGKVLNMTIVSMRGMDPGWQGERSVIVEGELVQGSEVFGTFRARHTSPGGGVLAGTADVCKGLKEIADFMGTDIANWLRKPQSGTKLGEQ